MSFKKKTYQIDKETANTALQNVFAACHETPNTIPFDKLVLREKAHTQKYDNLLIIIIIIIALTILAPLPFLGFKEYSAYSPIVLTKHYVAGNKLYLELDTGNHTINYEEAYLLSSGGNIYEIVSYDSTSYSLCFPYISKECNIYIPYDEDSLLHLSLTPTDLMEPK